MLKNQIVLAPYGTSSKKRTKVRILEYKPDYAKVEYVEKKVREELGDKPFLVQVKYLKPLIEVKDTGNNIIPTQWVSQYMKEFPEWINSTFLPYQVKEQINKKSKKNGWEYTSFQKFVRDYLSSSSPYRGLLLYHGLGSGKTCTSITVAENLKLGKNVIVLSPASLRTNYITALRTDCGVTAYKDNEDALREKYTFISYNASNTIEQLKRIPSIDNHTIVIDEAHNLISMIVSNSKKGPELYNMLMNARNLKIVALSGTPIINFPFEVAILCNILRGYIEVPTFFIKTLKDSGDLQWQMTILQDKTKELEHVNWVDTQQRYLYVYLNIQSYHPDFDETIQKILKNAVKFGVQIDYIETKKYSLFPDNVDEFHSYFIEETRDGDFIKNIELLKRRMIGLISYYRGGKPIYYPRMNPVKFVNVPMSDYQYQVYKDVREMERDKEKSGIMQKLLGTSGDSKSKKFSSLFRVFTRQFSNFVFPPEIERPFIKKFLADARKKKLEKKAKKSNKAADDLSELEKENKRMTEENSLNKKDKEVIADAIGKLSENREIFLQNTPDQLQRYSPKMAAMLEDMNKSPGLILVYSAFRSLEGIGIFSLVLETNGWILYDIESSNRPNKGEKRFAIYSGEENEETREKLRAVYNSPENKYGEELMALLVTSAGAEGIDLKNIRQVQIMEPFWHDMRINQVIGRANRYLSHIELPEKDREVNVFRYMTVLSPEQKKMDPEKQSTDEYMYEVALKKLKLTDEIKKIMKETAVDCVLNAVDNEKDIQCFTYGVNASGLGYKANIKEDLVYGKTEMAMKTVKKTLVPMFLDDDNNLIFADAKKKKLCYFYNKECKKPLKEPPKSVRKVAVDMTTFEVFDVESAKYGNPVKLGDVDEKGKLV
jgi:superfamily II DNA or RNA helicase